jgi:manganese transport protein
MQRPDEDPRTGKSDHTERARSLSEVHGSVPVPRHPTFWRRLFAFIGPGYLVSVGYMDPGNWATDIAAGASLGYALLWVLLMANVMAILLQMLSARLGIVTGMDLAQGCRAMFPRRVGTALWLLAEIGIAACDLAEILGTAIGLELLFGLPMLAGVLLTMLDTFLLLFLQGRGVRMMEALIVVLVITIGACLGIEVLLSQPDLAALAIGFVPSLPGEGALYLAIGILGATVMPHNLYLHSALVQSRRIVHTPAGIRSGVRFNIIDSVVALNGAFLVNAALLVMAAATFFETGHTGVAEIQEAHRLLEPILGAHLAPVAFAVALIAAGQSSTITGTLAGQIVMEGFLHLRLRPLIRRLITRGLALMPAVATILLAGEAACGRLLVLSQVVLSLQLSFAVIPLIHLVSDRRWMGQYRIRPAMQALAWLVAGTIAALNLALAYDEIVGWIAGAGDRAFWLASVVVPVVLALVGLLAYVTIVPFMQRRQAAPVGEHLGVHGAVQIPAVDRRRPPALIAVALDFTASDAPTLSYAVMLAKSTGGRIQLLHVVESVGARVLGEELVDNEARADQARLELFVAELEELGISASYDLGFGDPVDGLVACVAAHRPDLVVVGAHGHRGLQDLVYGTTVDKLRHRITMPVLVVPSTWPAG